MDCVAHDSEVRCSRGWYRFSEIAARRLASDKPIDETYHGRRRTFNFLQTVDLYPTSGAGDDYALSRHRANAALNKAHGFTMEFGYPTNFYPTLAEYHANLADTGAGLMEFCLAASDAGL